MSRRSSRLVEKAKQNSIITTKSSEVQLQGKKKRKTRATPSKNFKSLADSDVEYEEKRPQTSSTHKLAANSMKGQIFGLQVGSKKISHHTRCHTTELKRAKTTLTLLPRSLPARNKEIEEITRIIEGALCDDRCLGRCLYIHGVPGTGKTMSVSSIMRNLQAKVDAGKLRPHCIVEINGLKLSAPENIYRVIHESLTGQRLNSKKALQSLTKRFLDVNNCKDEQRPCILLIDELDLLLTRNQSVLYNIFDWPTKPQANLIVIGIANTMDLPDKLLPRISSRMGIERICFRPYTYQQLQEIISSRVEGLNNAFHKQAIEFVSRKVASISGDARHALEICRRAAEITDYNLKTQVGISEVEAAIQEMFQGPHVQVIKSCCKQAKILLTAMVHESYKTGMDEVTFEKLAMTVSYLCTSNGEEFIGYDALVKVCCRLGECKILLCESGAKHRLQKLRFNFQREDVSFALKDSKDVPWLAKYL